MKAHPSNRHTPVIVLTGMLGSGKTTLLSQLMTRSLLSDTAVILCEHGEAALDHHIIRPLTDGPVNVINGCPCCVVHDDIVNAMQELWARREIHREISFRRLIIETSGVTDPRSTVTTLMTNPTLTFRYRLTGVICTLDALFAISDFLPRESRSQVALADRFVVTKSDLLDGCPEGNLPPRFEAFKSLAPVFTAPLTEHTAPLLLDPRAYDRAAGTSDNSGSANHRLLTRTWRTDRRPSLPAFQNALLCALQQNGDRFLRIKGLVHVRERREPAVIQAIGHRLFPMSFLPDTSPPAPGTAITVFAVPGADAAVQQLVDTLDQAVTE